jgi:SAM-dependent methyltransferase
MSGAVMTLCEHRTGEPLYGGLLSRCRDCGLVSTSARPTFEYVDTYFTEDGKGGYDFDAPFARAHDEARFVAELRRLEAQGLKGRVLDVGCATGTFLTHAQRRGWSVSGVEVAAYGRAIAEKRLGVPLAGALSDLPAGARFDVVTLHHVLEHIDAPLSLLRDEVRPRVGRRLLVEVPNFRSLARRKHGPRWRDLRPDQHIYHYTAETLPPLLRAAGFAPVSVYTLWEPLWSLRTARDVLGLLPALVSTPVSDGAGAQQGPAAVTDTSAYVAPQGVKRAAVELSRVAFRPLVATLERAGLGERLVVEAEPA